VNDFCSPPGCGLPSFDDQITDADRAWVAARHRGSALLHHVDPRAGLTADDFTHLTDWARLMIR
jgi:hypothetical protein